MANYYLYEQRKFECNIVHNTLGNFNHMHNELELFYVYEGQIKAFVNFKEYILNVGDFLLVFPNTVHSFEKIGENVHMLCIFDKKIFPNFSNIFATKKSDSSPVVSKNSMNKEIDFCVKQIFDRKELHQKSNITEAYLQIILENICNNLELVELEYDAKQDLCQEVLFYLNKNYTKPISLENMAKELGVSKYHLSRNFNYRIGCSISQYVNKLRAEKALELIKTTDLPIINIAYEAGFESNSSFFRNFKKLGFDNPMSYRKNSINFKE